jgi:hypothetical protein
MVASHSETELAGIMFYIVSISYSEKSKCSRNKKYSSSHSQFVRMFKLCHNLVSTHKCQRSGNYPVILFSIIVLNGIDKGQVHPENVFFDWNVLFS